MIPYLAEVHMCQQREQLNVAAERYRITHDSTRRHSRRRRGRSGANRLRLGWRPVLVWVR
jgi:hypothetical protein